LRLELHFHLIDEKMEVQLRRSQLRLDEELFDQDECEEFQGQENQREKMKNNGQYRHPHPLGQYGPCVASHELRQWEQEQGFQSRLLTPPCVPSRNPQLQAVDLVMEPKFFQFLKHWC
jgi:hypothetical protein